MDPKSIPKIVQLTPSRLKLAPYRAVYEKKYIKKYLKRARGLYKKKFNIKSALQKRVIIIPNVFERKRRLSFKIVYRSRKLYNEKVSKAKEWFIVLKSEEKQKLSEPPPPKDDLKIILGLLGRGKRIDLKKYDRPDLVTEEKIDKLSDLEELQKIRKSECQAREVAKGWIKSLSNDDTDYIQDKSEDSIESTIQVQVKKPKFLNFDLTAAIIPRSKLKALPPKPKINEIKVPVIKFSSQLDFISEKLYMKSKIYFQSMVDVIVHTKLLKSLPIQNLLVHKNLFGVPMIYQKNLLDKKSNVHALVINTTLRPPKDIITSEMRFIYYENNNEKVKKFMFDTPYPV